jgi:hypothetical protein
VGHEVRDLSTISHAVHRNAECFHLGTAADCLQQAPPKTIQGGHDDDHIGAVLANLPDLTEHRLIARPLVTVAARDVHEFGTSSPSVGSDVLTAGGTLNRQADTRPFLLLS